MSWVAAAVIGGAVIGGVSSKRAGDKAISGQKDAAQIFRAATDKAGSTATQLIERAQDRTRRATRQTLNLLGQTPERVTAPFQQGNVLAQGAISAGLEQQQAAILGQPTDFSAFAPQTIRAPRGINTQNLQLGLPEPPPVDPVNPNILDPNQQFTGRIAI